MFVVVSMTLSVMTMVTMRHVRLIIASDKEHQTGRVVPQDVEKLSVEVESIFLVSSFLVVVIVVLMLVVVVVNVLLLLSVLPPMFLSRLGAK